MVNCEYGFIVNVIAVAAGPLMMRCSGKKILAKDIERDMFGIGNI